jgi:ferritin-like metal-binding protein YciE
MEKMNDLHDLLKHELMDLYSAEEQIIAAMPAMIEKAKSPQLIQALQQHLQVTERQRQRLEQVQRLIGAEDAGESKGLLNRLFKSRQVCKGMQGILEEGTKVMKEDMHPDVMDAAIIACSQKVEHYEICGYGTARAFARELNLSEIERLLGETLDEEYQADQLLTSLAESQVNKKAEAPSGKGRQPAPTQSKGRGSSERIRTQEPEMEMASARRGSGAASSAAGTTGSTGTSRRTAAAGSNAPKSGTTGARGGSITGNRTATAGNKQSAASKSTGTGSRNSGGATGRGEGSGRTRNR